MRRSSTTASGTSTCGPATARSASTRSSGIPLSSVPRVTAGSGSGGSMWIRSTSAYDIGPTPPSTGSATARIGASSRSASSAEPVNPNRSARLTVPRSGGGTSSTGGSRSRATDVVASSGRVRRPRAERPQHGLDGVAGEEQGTADEPRHRDQPELDRRDDAEAALAATQRPEQLRVAPGGDRHELSPRPSPARSRARGRRRSRADGRGAPCRRPACSRRPRPPTTTPTAGPARAARRRRSPGATARRPRHARPGRPGRRAGPAWPWSTRTRCPRPGPRPRGRWPGRSPAGPRPAPRARPPRRPPRSAPRPRRPAGA